MLRRFFCFWQRAPLRSDPSGIRAAHAYGRDARPQEFIDKSGVIDQETATKGCNGGKLPPGSACPLPLPSPDSLIYPIPGETAAALQKLHKPDLPTPAGRAARPARGAPLTAGRESPILVLREDALLEPRSLPKTRRGSISVCCGR